MIRVLVLLMLLLASCTGTDDSDPAPASPPPTSRYQSLHGLTFDYPDGWFVVEEHEGRQVFITNREAVAAGDDPRLYEDVFALRLFAPVAVENILMSTGVAITDPPAEMLRMFTGVLGATTLASPVRDISMVTVGDTPAARGEALDLWLAGAIYMLDFGPETRVAAVLLVSDLAQYGAAADTILTSLACYQ